jgi:hypothetical protein
MRAGAKKLTAEFWSTVLPWATVAFSVLALLSTGAGIIARDKVAVQKDSEIRKLKPRMISEAQRAALIEGLRSSFEGRHGDTAHGW